MTHCGKNVINIVSEHNKLQRAPVVTNKCLPAMLYGLNACAITATRRKSLSFYLKHCQGLGNRTK